MYAVAKAPNGLADAEAMEVGAKMYERHACMLKHDDCIP